MATKRRKKPCRFCRRWFAPDARVGDQQVACGAAECQRARKRDAQAAWLGRQPGYFHGRADAHRRWRHEHPDAQRQRRAGDPALRERERLDRARRRRQSATQRAVEQDARALQLIAPAGDSTRVPCAVEQDAMRAQLHVLIGVASRLPPAVEQVPIAGALRTWHDLGRRIVGGVHAAARTP